MRMMSSGRCLTLPTCVLPCPPMWRCAHRLSSRCNNWKPPACSGSRRWRRASSKTWTIGFARICRCAWRDARSQPQPVGQRAGARRSSQRCSTQHRAESLDTESVVTTRACIFQAPSRRPPSLLLLANALHLHWRPLHQTKSPEKPGFLLLHATRQALRFFNQAAICGTRRSRNVTRVWMVLMAVSASRREVGAR